MVVTCVSEAENLVSDNDILVVLESPDFDRRYLIASVSEIVVLLIQNYCCLHMKLAKILFSRWIDSSENQM